VAEELAGIVLNAGFTTVRNVGTYKAWVARDLKDQIEAGFVAGPRIRFAGPYLTIPHGGGDMYIPGIDDSEIPDYYRMALVGRMNSAPEQSSSSLEARISSRLLHQALCSDTAVYRVRRR